METKTHDALLGLEKSTAARIAASTWLRRARIVDSQIADASTIADTQLDLVCGGASIIVQMNLEAAELAQRRVQKCASVVMRVETEQIIVSQTVARLSRVKMDLAERANAVAVASDSLLQSMPFGASVEKASSFRATVDALQRLLEAIDKATELLTKCPLESQKLDLVAGDLSNTDTHAHMGAESIAVEEEEYE
eukprot:CAMPEP_0169197960 /NCGR_PEP_ID=MMETSP1016-20121227/8559_1 /TAXON_ID=342587 /ORGANISM="Karlodinium micrum, Strain CCMP2283" /LENGTH=193 /DNA_ID=CAMNT_0009274667 /DNA_START=192 /DNA_END=774 /DNA_ORIENTATION=+